MTRLTVRIREDDFDALGHALEQAEEVVFLYATEIEGVLQVDGIEIMADADIASRSRIHVELADAVRPRTIKTAWDTKRCLIESHSHGKWGVAEFSRSDLLGFEEWVAHVRWRLRGRPYVALVKAGETWDALAWVNDQGPDTIEVIEVIRSNTLIDRIAPTNATMAKLGA